MRKLILIMFCAFLAGCAGPKISQLPIATGHKYVVRMMAMTAGGGLLADAVAVDLSNQGFNVLDSEGSSTLMARLNLTEFELTQPEGLSKLRNKGIDAVLSVRAAAGYDQDPQSASARINSTTNGKIIAGIVWQNGWGGQAGSIADRSMREGLAAAASEIASALAKQLKQQQ